jgi:putative NADH-flavin reductase
LTQVREKRLQVNALVRQPDKLRELRDYVSPVQGDVTDPSAVERAVAGCSAAVSVLGRRPESPADLLTVASLNITAAMKKEGIKRLVVLVDTGVQDPSDRLPLTQRILRFALYRINDRLSRDSRSAARIVSDSGLDWTLVRPPILTDGPRTGNYRVGALARGMPLRISRADVAEFMLTCVIEDKFIHERPAVGGGHPK